MTKADLDLYEQLIDLAAASQKPVLVSLKSNKNKHYEGNYVHTRVPGGERFLYEPTVEIKAVKENVTINGKTYTTSSAWIYTYDSAEASIKDNLSTTKGIRYQKDKLKTEWYGRITVESADPAEYPHKCPRCQAPAYIGFSSVDCFKKCQ